MTATLGGTGPEDRTVDDALVSRIGSGDVNAMREFYVRHGGRVTGFARRILGDPHEAEDATQEVFVRAWKRASDYDAALASPWAWLAMMTRSVCLDRLRHRRRRPDMVHAGATVHEVEANSLSYQSESPARFAGEDIDRLLALLKPAERLCFTRIFFEGLSQAEAAAETGLPLGSVKTHIRRGLERLRRALSSHDS